MTQENRVQNEPETPEPQADSGNLHERVAKLKEKVSTLSETLERVEQTVQEEFDQSH